MPDVHLLPSGKPLPPPPPIPSDSLYPATAHAHASSSSSASIKLRRTLSTRSFAKRQPKEQKGSFYSKELEAARLRGEWDSDVPLSAGPRLPWSELIRKHLKHNPNDQTVPSVASAEHQLRSSLAAFYRQKGFGDASYQNDNAIPGGSGTCTFPPPLPLDDQGNGWSGQDYQEAIKQLSALRNNARDSVTKYSIAALHAYALFASGQDEGAVELFHEVRFLEDLDLASLKAGKFNDEYTLALILMGYTVYGMANERLFYKQGDQGYIPFAYAGYACTIDLHETIRGGKSANALRGLLDDEVERWGEVALYRNALMSVRHGNMTMALNSLRAYQAHAGRWASNFRETQQLVIFRVYLRLLNRSVEEGSYTAPRNNVVASRDDCRSAAYQTSVVAASASRAVIRDFESERASRQSPQSNGTAISGKATLPGQATSRTTSTRRIVDYRGVQPPGGSFWSNEFLTVKKAAADIVARSSQFPRAGEVNGIALDLADEIVRGWQLNGERNGDWADETVEVLYQLSRVTFHSQRITRHLFTLLVASENYSEAKKALQLYIQIVDKAREGNQAEERNKKQDEESKKETQGQGQEESQDGPAADVEKEIKGEDDLNKQQQKEPEQDLDSDEDYVHTLLYGVHVYIKNLQDGRAADALARKVIEFVDAQPEKTLAKDFTLWAKVKRMGGVARAAFCATENNAANRTTLQKEALSLLKQSATLDDQSAETFYALAYLQSEMLEGGNSIQMARRAVELEPASVESWHLLTLLLSSQKDFKGALNVAEEGLAEAEDDDEADATSSKPASKGVYTNGSTEKAVSCPTLLLSVDYPPRGTERAQSILRLMMTHNALEEVVEGGLAAIEGQREIFEFFHRRVGFNLLSHGTSHRIGVPGINGTEGQVTKGTPSQGQPTTTVLGGPVQTHNRFHSLSGLGQSGSHHHLLPLHSSASPHQGEESHQAATTVGAPMLVQDQEQSQAITLAQNRNALHNKQETFLLASLWLMSAATFRRNGKLTQCRVAIQEAERVDPGEAEVWVQLALWFEQQPHRHGQQPAANLSIQCLYKALACKQDHVGATIHLARIFLSNPTNPSIRDVQQAIANVASPLPQTTDNVQSSHLASELLSHTQSRRITASSAAPTKDEVDKDKKDSKGHCDPAKESKLAQDGRRLATVSLAEGLLYNLTQSNGWNVSEAWLFLARVMKETNRPEKQREYLEYALELEKAKSIRPLPIAINRL